MEPGTDAGRDAPTAPARAAVWLALSSVPALVLAVHLHRYGVDVPYWDQWRTIEFLDAAHRGALSPGDFFGQHNEHRPAFPLMLIVTLGALTSWNTRAELVQAYEDYQAGRLGQIPHGAIGNQ